MRIFINAMHLRRIRTGVGNYTHHLVEALARVDRENEYTIFCGASLRQSIPGLANQIWTDSPNFYHRLIRFPYILFKIYVKAFPRGCNFLLRDANIYHETNYVPFTSQNGCKKISTIFDMSYKLYPEFHPKKRVFFMSFNEKKMRNVDHILTISENAKSEIVDILNIPEERVTVTYPACGSSYCLIEDKQHIRSWLEGLGIRKEFVLYVGTLEPRKNIETILFAVHLLKERKSADILLVLVGARGWLYRGILNLIEELGLRENVKVLGYIPEEDLPVLYNGAELFVFPSFYEGFGLPPLEAMACGCPVITSSSPSLSEVVGDAGIMVSPYDVEALAFEIERVLHDSELRTHLREKGIARAKQFSWGKCARETLAVYEKVAAG